MASEKKRYESGYDPSENKEYQDYLRKLEAAREKKPAYQGLYRQEVKDLYDRLSRREDFSYDIDSDALYRQYRDQYTRQGALAMEDAMGQAQAMTGGYGNSYAQSVGQQTYQRYLGELNSKLPELYSQALERYRQGFSDLQQRYELASAMEQQEYEQHKDALDAYRKDLAFLQSQADQAYDRGYQSYLEGYRMHQDAYERLMDLVDRRGYVPTAEELMEVGMDRSQAEAFLTALKKK